MWNLLKSELLKLRRCQILLVGLVALALCPLVQYGSQLIVEAEYRNPNYDFSALFENVVWGNTQIFLPISLVMIGGWLIDRESTHDTLKNIMTIPVSIPKMLGAKLLLVGMLAVLLGIYSVGITLITGLTVGLSGLTAEVFFHGGTQIVLAALTTYLACMPLILIVSAFSAFVASGGAPRASIYMGKQDHDTAEKILGGCFALQLAVSAVLTAVLLLWSRDLLLAFGASENTIGYAASYMQIYAVGTVFVQLTLGLNAFITAQGFAKIGMRTVLIGAVANIVLDPIFIYGLHMGVRGAALATILSQGLSCIWVLRFLTGPKTLLRLKKENVRFRPALILPCVALGTATFIMQASESVISVCFNSSLLKYGDDIAVGAMTILSSVMQFAMLPLQGIAQGAQPITSYNYGARNTQRVRQTFRLLLKVCLCYSVALWAVIQLCPGAFARIFTPNAALVAFTVPAPRIYCGALFLFGIQIACQMTFVSIGAAGCSIIVAVLRKFVLLLPLIYLMPRLLADQTMAVYTAEPVADAIAVTCTAILFAVQFRKALRKLDAED